MTSFLKNMKSGTVELNYGREQIVKMAVSHFGNRDAQSFKIMDLGLGLGEDILRIKRALAPQPVDACGLEFHEPYVKQAQEKGIEVFQLNLEKDPFPFEDSTFDLILANQVLEHTKEIFWITSEVARVLRPGGLFLVGVPNLASLHSRIMLLLGMQPSPIQVLGPHVRGFTKKGFKSFVEEGGYFRVKQIAGSNFYPFPAFPAKLLAKLFPGFAVSLFFACERTPGEGNFIDLLSENFFETPFFRG
jgi:SAM-dependent methyltransferase